LGKNWACQQLADRADGEFLLFVDADTRHKPEMLQYAVAAMEAEEADLLSAIPREEVDTWAERLVVPLIPWSIFSFVPVAIAHRIRWAWLSAAIGQFMLFRRSAYETVGGHASVRLCTVDDISLARRVKSAGLRWRLVDGTGNINCRMYRNGHEVVQGVSRTLFAVFENRIAVHLFVWLWLAIAFIEPPVVLSLRLAAFPISSTSVGLASAAVAVSVTLWLIAYGRLGIPRYLVLIYPLTILLAAGLAIRSAVATVTGRVTWRGRHLAAAP
jgi:chlorobactene glucosyltransferase